MNIPEIYNIYLQHPVVTTDSRHVPANSIFFALRGDTFNGNQFAAGALANGAAFAVVDDPAVVVADDSRYILVPDVLQTLQQLAAHHRLQFRYPVLQVTGTNGKTTTKELLAAVISRRYRVLYTQGNLNNHIGVPLTLLRLRPADHDFAIVETGANHPGEIADLTRLVQPDSGLITNVGRAHLQGFGSFDGVKRTKGELYDYLARQPHTHIFVNQSNGDLCEMLSQRQIPLTPPRVLAYARHSATSSGALCEGEVISCDPMLRFWWRIPGRDTHTVQTHLIGAYNIDNVLASVAVGLHYGVAPEDIDCALTDYQPTLGRSEYRQTPRHQLIIDAYNANLTSMEAALDNFAQITHPHKMIILGDMKELGSHSSQAHLRILQRALREPFEALWLVGDEFQAAATHLDPAAAARLRLFSDVEAVKAAIQQDSIPDGRLILIKGSNSTRLHQLPPLL